MLVKLVEAAKDCVVADDGSPEVVVVVGVCRAATLDELVMAVVELGVGAVPVGVKVVVRGKVVAVVSVRDTMLPVVVGDGSVIDVIPEVVETRVTLAVPAVGVTPAIDSLPVVYELDVDTFWPDTNIDVRSIPSRSTFKIPMLPGIIVKKKANYLIK